jgi:hypothetical protein
VPVTHPIERDSNVASREFLAFVSNRMHRDDSAIPREEPQHPRIELAYMAQFKQSLTQGNLNT